MQNFSNNRRGLENREIEDFLIDRGDQGILPVEAEDTAEHPVRKMEGMGKAYPIDPQATLFHVRGLTHEE